MPTNFESFRYLNDSGRATADVRYGAHADKEADPAALIFQAGPVPVGGNALADNAFITSAPPGGAGVQGVRSVRVQLISIADPGPPAGTDDLVDWVLTSEFFEEDMLRAVEILVEALDPQAPAPPFRATARLYFGDTTFEERVRFFP